MKKYLLKDTIKNLETGTTLIYYQGVDGYIQDDAHYCEPYKRRGCVVNLIKRQQHYFNCEPLNDFQHLEGKKWLHTCEVVEF